jgi:hypothetical protein
MDEETGFYNHYPQTFGNMDQGLGSLAGGS